MYEKINNNNRGKDGRIEVLPVNYSIPTEKLKESYALVDGMNISLIRKKNQRGRLEDILKVAEMIAESYDHVEIYIDASLRHRIDDLVALDKFIEDGTIFCCPAGITADSTRKGGNYKLQRGTFSKWVRFLIDNKLLEEKYNEDNHKNKFLNITPDGIFAVKFFRKIEN